MSLLASLHAFRLWLRLRLFHIPFTLLSAVVTVVLLSLVQSIERRPTFVTFTVVASVWTGIVALETICVVAEEWQETVRFFVRRRSTTRASSSSPPQRSVLTNILAILDVYFALCASCTLVGMAPWLFDETADKHLYYNGFETTATGIQERDPWVVYFYFLCTSFMVYNGVGFAKVIPIVSWLGALYGSLSVIGYVYTMSIIGTVFGVFFVNIHDQRNDAHTHDFSSTPSASVGDDGTPLYDVESQSHGSSGVGPFQAYSSSALAGSNGVGGGGSSLIIGHDHHYQQQQQQMLPVAAYGTPGTMASFQPQQQYAPSQPMGGRRSVVHHY